MALFDVLGRSRRNEDREKYGDRVPPGQKVVPSWPVLTYGVTPRINLKEWQFHVSGLVAEEKTFTWEEFMALPQTEITCDIHCVTGWSRMDSQFTGVLFKDLWQHITPLPEARYAMVHCYGGYTTNVSLDDLMRDNVMFAHSHRGEPLTPEHGGPLRLVIPHLYFWKSAKWVRGIQLMDRDRPGFWETYGYHMRGDPFKEERYG